MMANKVSEIYELSIKEQLEGLKKYQFSSAELVNSYINRIEELNPVLNSFITLTLDRAQEKAKESDKRYQKSLIYL